MLEFIQQPWAWYFSGPMIAFVMFLLLRAGREFGISATLRTACSILGAGKKVPFSILIGKVKYGIWSLPSGGALIGGFIATNFLSNPTDALILSEATQDDLEVLGISFNGDLAPYELFSWNSIFTLQGFASIILGGFFVGFGTRWAGGCTSGHAISGLSNLQLPSLIAVVGFFIGGLIMTHLMFPLLFKGFNTEGLETINVVFSN